MRQALAGKARPRLASQPGYRAEIGFMPFPTQGWDTETPVAELPPTRARLMDNWIPHGTAGEIRKGHSDHVTGIAAPVETLMPYNAGAISALFAAAGASIYNATSPGAVGAAVVTGLTGVRFSHVNFSTSGGAFLWICNGLDAPRHWNGAAWATPSLTITTYSASDIFWVFAFKERLFFLFKNTLTFGYLPVQSITGTVSNFPLGAVFNFGGRLIAAGSLSRDGGAGLDDYAIFLTSEGEVAVYAGANPGDANDWALVGVYYVGDPVGDRPLVELSGDVGVITQNGLISISAVMSGRFGADADVFARVATPFRTAAAQGQGFNGWEGLVVPSENLVLLNAPTAADEAVQFVLHQTSKGPSRFTGWDFLTFEIFGNRCYAGTADGRVALCFDDYDDDGADITAAVSTGWSQLGNPLIKTMLEARPILTTATLASLRMVARTDFREQPPLGAWPSSTVTNAGIWDETNWDECLWGGEDSTARQWRAISGEGANVSLVIEARTNQSAFSLNGIQVRFGMGGQV